MTDAVEQATGNPYLLGNYAPVADEVTAFDLSLIHI